MLLSECISPIDLITPSPHLTYIAIAMNYQIKLIGPGKTQRYFSSHKFKISLMVWSHDQHLLGSCSLGGQTIIWSVEHHRVLFFKVQMSRVCQMYFEPASKLVYVLDKKGNFQIREGSTRKVFFMKGSAWDDERIVEFAVGRGCGVMALGYRNGNIKIYKEMMAVGEIFCHRPLKNMLFNEDCSYLCCICRNDELFIYESDTGKRTYIDATPTLNQIKFLDQHTVMGLSKGQGFHTVQIFNIQKEVKQSSKRLKIEQSAILTQEGQNVVYKTIKRTGDCCMDYVNIDKISRLVQEVPQKEAEEAKQH